MIFNLQGLRPLVLAFVYVAAPSAFADIDIPFNTNPPDHFYSMPGDDNLRHQEGAFLCDGNSCFKAKIVSTPGHTQDETIEFPNLPVISTDKNPNAGYYSADALLRNAESMHVEQTIIPPQKWIRTPEDIPKERPSYALRDPSSPDYTIPVSQFQRNGDRAAGTKPPLSNPLSPTRLNTPYAKGGARALLPSSVAPGDDGGFPAAVTATGQ